MLHTASVNERLVRKFTRIIFFSCIWTGRRWPGGSMGPGPQPRPERPTRVVRIRELRRRYRTLMEGGEIRKNFGPHVLKTWRRPCISGTPVRTLTDCTAVISRALQRPRNPVTVTLAVVSKLRQRISILCRGFYIRNLDSLS